MSKLNVIFGMLIVVLSSCSSSYPSLYGNKRVNKEKYTTGQESKKIKYYNNPNYRRKQVTKKVKNRF
ncbi:hypothetical protein QQ008_06235 [Fulvivirgaceae bacterium BMA10]|uniref:Lipoprotein n=1 Tax=Splendidivirga corallicola TaxID=3051826 RepID=A0ABT8KJR5_9BACT|nr:hypothetical protein [Fulvivirgaceae bacterium BMA10]